jgi:hypothetical protein
MALLRPELMPPATLLGSVALAGGIGQGPIGNPTVQRIQRSPSLNIFRMLDAKRIPDGISMYFHYKKGEHVYGIKWSGEGFL